MELGRLGQKEIRLVAYEIVITDLKSNQAQLNKPVIIVGGGITYTANMKEEELA